MEKKKFGLFVKEARSKKGYTQKELADKLFIDVTAVSKWERGVSFPDITLVSKLSEALGVTEHELITASVDQQARQEKSQAKKWRAFSMSWSLFFYISYIVALIPCFICDLAINKGLTWFWIVLSSLLLAFTFTNLPKLIKKHKLIFVPLSMFISLCLLLGVCCLYTGGNWFFVATISVLLGISCIFTPIYICKFKVFEKIKKFGDFVSVGVDFVLLNVLLIICDFYSVGHNHTANHWYLNIGLPIAFAVYMALNILMSVRFLKANKCIKTSIILILIDILYFIVPFIKVKNSYAQQDINDINIFKADFSNWNAEFPVENNIHFIIFLSLLVIGIGFLVAGLLIRIKKTKKTTVKLKYLD